MIYHSGVCNFCGTGCGHLLQVEDGAIRGVYPSPGHPVGKGRLCVRGWHIHELLASEERLTRPQIRRPDGLQAASWDEALQAAADGLRRFSPGQIGVWASPRASNEAVFSLVRMARGVLRTPHIDLLSDHFYSSTAEVLRRGAGLPGALGSLADIRGADFLLVVGTDLTRQNPIVASELHFAAKAGADLTTIASRTTQMARLSRTHLRPAPGAKTAVLAAMIKILVEEGLADPAFAAGRLEGSEAVLQSLRTINLDVLVKASGLDQDALRGLVRRLAKAERAMAFFSSGTTGLGRDGAALIYDLFLAAGKIGRPGCGIIPLVGISNLAGANDMGAAPDRLPGWRPAGDASARDGLRSAWGQAAEASPGRRIRDLLRDPAKPLRALLVADHDEEINLLAGEIGRLEHVVYLGAFGNPFTDLAHVVLPAATSAEGDGTYTNTERRIQLNRAKTEPRFEARPAWRIASGRRSGSAFRSSAGIDGGDGDLVPLGQDFFRRDGRPVAGHDSRPLGRDADPGHEIAGGGPLRNVHLPLAEAGRVDQRADDLDRDSHGRIRDQVRLPNFAAASASAARSRPARVARVGMPRRS